MRPTRAREAGAAGLDASHRANRALADGSEPMEQPAAPQCGHVHGHTPQHRTPSQLTRPGCLRSSFLPTDRGSRAGSRRLKGFHSKQNRKRWFGQFVWLCTRAGVSGFGFRAYRPRSLSRVHTIRPSKSSTSGAARRPPPAAARRASRHSAGPPAAIQPRAPGRSAAALTVATARRRFRPTGAAACVRAAPAPPRATHGATARLALPRAAPLISSACACAHTPSAMADGAHRGFGGSERACNASPPLGTRAERAHGRGAVSASEP